MDDRRKHGDSRANGLAVTEQGQVMAFKGRAAGPRPHDFGFESGNVIRPVGSHLRIDKRVNVGRFSQGLLGTVMSAITLPMHL